MVGFLFIQRFLITMNAPAKIAKRINATKDKLTTSSIFVKAATIDCFQYAPAFFVPMHRFLVDHTIYDAWYLKRRGEKLKKSV